MRILGFIYVDFYSPVLPIPTVGKGLIGGTVSKIGSRNPETDAGMYQISSQKFEFDDDNLESQIRQFVSENSDLALLRSLPDIQIERMMLSIASTDCDSGEYLSFIFSGDALNEISNSGFSLEIWNAEILPEVERWASHSIS